MIFSCNYSLATYRRLNICGGGARIDNRITAAQTDEWDYEKQQIHFKFNNIKQQRFQAPYNKFRCSFSLIIILDYNRILSFSQNLNRRTIQHSNTNMRTLSYGKRWRIIQAQSRYSPQRYIIKQIQLQYFSEDNLKEFHNFANILQQLNSPWFVEYVRLFKQKNRLNIVMKSMNDNLKQRIKSYKKNGTKFDERDIWKVLLHSIIALRKLQNKNLMHKDLKSEKIYFDKYGNIKIDFLCLQKSFVNLIYQYEFQTPFYASPQILKEKPQTLSSNIWSLGCIIYEMATLNHPFGGQTISQLYQNVLNGKYAKINGYSQELSSMISCMLQVKDKKRAKIGQILEKIQKLAGQFRLESDWCNYLASLSSQGKENKIKMLPDISKKVKTCSNQQVKLYMKGKSSQKHHKDHKMAIKPIKKELSLQKIQIKGKKLPIISQK